MTTSTDRPRERQVALAAKHRAPAETGPERQHPVARALGRGFRREVAVGGLDPAGQQPVQPAREQG